MEPTEDDKGEPSGEPTREVSGESTREPTRVIDQQSLDWATRGAAFAVDALVVLHGNLLDAQARCELPDPAEVLAMVEYLDQETQRAYRTLVRLGGRGPLVEGTLARHQEQAGMNLLDELGTADTRELLRLLLEAQAAAQRVDAARGRVIPADVPLLAGESRGMDLERSVQELVLRIRREEA